MASVIVNYRTVKEYFSCCGQKLPEKLISEIRTFEFSKQRALNRSDRWEDVSEDIEDLDANVWDFVVDTIKFDAVDSGVRLLIEESEIVKVRNMILQEIVNADTE